MDGAYSRAWLPRQDTSVTITLFALCVLPDRSILRAGQYGLMLSASFADRGTEFSLRLFGPSGRRKAASDGNSESRIR